MPERFLFTVSRHPQGSGCLVPADATTETRLREKGYRIGDTLHASLAKPRNPRFNRLAHAFGRVCAENIEAFQSMDAHAVLKRLQLEANVACDEMAINVPGVGPCEYRLPRSMSFASMDEGDFRELFEALVAYVAQRYWPSATEAEIERMAEVLAGGQG